MSLPVQRRSYATASPVSMLPDTMVSGIHAVLQPTGHVDRTFKSDPASFLRHAPLRTDTLPSARTIS